MKYDNYEKRIGLIVESIIEADDIACVLSFGNTVVVLEELADYIDNEVDNFVSESELDGDTFMITKMTNIRTNEVTVVLEPIDLESNGDGLVAGIGEIYGEFVIIEKGLFTDAEKQSIQYEEALMEVELYGEEEVYTYSGHSALYSVNEEDLVLDSLEAYAEYIMNLGCKGCVLEVLRSIYDFAYNQGSKDELLRIGEEVSSRILDKEE